MGKGYTVSCSNCSYSETVYLGVGFAYPKVYEETVEAIKEGDLGPDLKTIFLEHPQAAVDIETVLLHCRDCGLIGAGRDLSVFYPKEGYDHTKRERHRWSTVMPCYDVEYVSPGELKEHYDLFKRYIHRCAKCGKPLDTIREEEMRRASLKCPQCGKELMADNNIMWD